MISVLKNISVVAGFMFLASCGGGDSVGDTGSSLEAPMLLFPLETGLNNSQEANKIKIAMKVQILLPFNRCRWFCANIIDDSIYTFYIINNFT